MNKSDKLIINHTRFGFRLSIDTFGAKLHEVGFVSTDFSADEPLQGCMADTMYKKVDAYVCVCAYSYKQT